MTAIYCPLCRNLLDAFAEAVQQLGELHNQQFQAIVQGEADLSRFDLLIHEVTEKKQQAKYSYLEHLEMHGHSQHDGIEPS
ncbi:MAG TPA: hypothetical protein VM120_22415 [Bryobacteraceae bacterium]|nr:hypothetical protein [Bryobacteraceae bacterium]